MESIRAPILLVTDNKPSGLSEGNNRVQGLRNAYSNVRETQPIV